jgi:hypothetical protein
LTALVNVVRADKRTISKGRTCSDTAAGDRVGGVLVRSASGIGDGNNTAGRSEA